MDRHLLPGGGARARLCGFRPPQLQLHRRPPSNARARDDDDDDDDGDGDDGDNRSIALQRIQKALNLDVKEEKTELMVMMCMQKAFDNANAAGVAPPKEAIMATAAAEQPHCAAWLHHLFAYVQGSGGNGELLRDLDAYTKAAARTNMAVARSDAPPLPRPLDIRRGSGDIYVAVGCGQLRRATLPRALAIHRCSGDI